MKINKKGIRFLSGISILLYGGFNLTFVGGLLDKNIDHTEEICPTTKKYFDSSLEAEGIRHQILNMQKDYLEKDMEVQVFYEDGNFKPFLKTSANFYECDHYLSLNK